MHVVVTYTYMNSSLSFQLLTSHCIEPKSVGSSVIRRTRLLKLRKMSPIRRVKVFIHLSNTVLTPSIPPRLSSYHCAPCGI